MKGWKFYVKDVTAGYGGVPLLRDISIEVEAGECILLCGANGTGKSTLFRTFAGMQQLLSGSLGFEGQVHGGGIFLIPGRIPKVRGFTVREFIATMCFKEADWLGRIRGKVRRNIMEAIEATDMTDLADRDISSLSDGEFQKAGIAAALVQKAEIILLDEPTAFLDVDSRESVLSVLVELASEKAGRSVIFSSHDLQASLRHCSRVWGIANCDNEEPCCGNILIDSGKNVTGQAIRSIISRCFATYIPDCK